MQFFDDHQLAKTVFPPMVTANELETENEVEEDLFGNGEEIPANAVSSKEWHHQMATRIKMMVKTMISNVL